jgi:hypothetical protein
MDKYFQNNGNYFAVYQNSNLPFQRSNPFQPFQYVPMAKYSSIVLKINKMNIWYYWNPFYPFAQLFELFSFFLNVYAFRAREGTFFKFCAMLGTGHKQRCGIGTGTKRTAKYVVRIGTIGTAAAFP